MGNWNDIMREINRERDAGISAEKTRASAEDKVRRKYLKELSDLTERNVIIYYSGWLQKDVGRWALIDDSDKEGFMTVVHKLDKSKGLDLVLHTPGGETSATESLVYYLKEMFGNDIRVIVPQIAMSAGTMIACASKEIVMGRHSNLGPIDPQLRGVAANLILEDFEKARNEIANHPERYLVWRPILSQYSPGIVSECQKAISWSKGLVTKWLLKNMHSKAKDREQIVERIVNALSDHDENKSHSRHLSPEKCEGIGFRIKKLEEDQKLQDAVLSLHHACILTLSSTSCFKMIENQEGVSFITHQRS